MAEYKSFYKVVGGNEGSKCHYPARLDLYGCGCEHDCKYCYAKSLLNFRKLWNPMAPSVADLAKVQRRIRKLEPGATVRLGGMTDCFMPSEKIKRNTYHAIQMLNEHDNPYLIVTKSAMVADPEYLRIMDHSLAHIQVTVTTLNDDFCSTYEKASRPSERIRAILKLQEEGFDVAIRLSPYIPQFWLGDLHKLKGYGIRKALVEFLRVNAWIRKWFDLDYSEYTVKHGGYCHLPLHRKVVYLRPLQGIFPELTVCEDETVAYEYWKRNVNPNPEDCCNLRRTPWGGES